MGLKSGDLRSSLRNISTGASDIPDSGVIHDYSATTDLNDYSGSTGDWDINTNSPVLLDTHSLKLTATNFNTIVSTSGLPNYFPKGESASVFVYDGGASPRTLFGAADTSNAFMAQLNTTDNELTIEKRSSGSDSQIASSNVSLSADTWYDLEIEWANDDTITVTGFNVDQSDGSRQSEAGSVSTTDSSFGSNTGIGYRHNSGSGSCTWDYYRLVP